MTDIRIPGLKARVQYLYDQWVLEKMQHDAKAGAIIEEYMLRLNEIWEIENGEA